MARLSLIFLLFLLMIASLSAYAGTPDRHESGDPASPLYRQSVFAHGYIHGYEAGFHVADDDYQMGRAARDVRELREFKGADAGYREEFGSKQEFRQGFREGFRAGYDDSFHNRPFGAVSAARVAADGLQSDAHPDVNFEAGFVDGYHAASTGTAQSCVSQRSPASKLSLNYCDGFGRGFQFGLQTPSTFSLQSEQQAPQAGSQR